MENVLDFLKKHKKKVIAVAIALIIFIIIFIAFKKVVNYLSPSTKQSVYGDRCAAVAKIPVKNDTKDAIKNFFKEYELVEFKKTDVKCRLIDIIINDAGSHFDPNIVEVFKEVIDDFKKTATED